jgi:hypothetical protein
MSIMSISVEASLLPASCVGEENDRLLFERIMPGAPGGELRWFSNGHAQVLFAAGGHIFWLPLTCDRLKVVQHLLQHRQHWQDPWERFSGILRKIERSELRWYPWDYADAVFHSGEVVLLHRGMSVHLVRVRSCLLRKDGSYAETMYFVRPIEQVGSEQFVFEHELAYPAAERS